MEKFAAVLFIGLCAASAGAKTSETFDKHGVIVDIHTFFTAIGAPDSAVAVACDTVAGRALVAEDGVYAFLETPENKAHLAQTAAGSVVRIQGKWLKEGALVHIERLEKLTTVPLIDFARFRKDQGVEVALSGVNKCQCGLDVGGLPHSCDLGHLHHLEAADGKIYHYLQFAQGRDAFLGKGLHFAEVSVKGRVLPGNYLVVQEVRSK